MILSDTDLAERLDSGDIVVDPIEDFETQIQPASIDVRLGNEFLEFERTNISCIHPYVDHEVKQYVSDTHISDDDEFILHPGDFVLGTTQEHIEVPPDLVATIEGRSSLGRLAIVVHATAGWVDPGYRGQVTLELSNLGNAPVALKPGSRVAQLVFTEMRSEATRPYGPERGSKYQDQRGPQPSQIQNDTDVEVDQEQ